MGSASRTAPEEDEIRLRVEEDDLDAEDPERDDEDVEIDEDDIDYDPAEDPDTDPPASGDGP